MDPEDKAFIETVAKRVKNNGKDFERVLRQKERHNTKFSFMFDSNVSGLPSYLVYRLTFLLFRCQNITSSKNSFHLIIEVRTVTYHSRTRFVHFHNREAQPLNILYTG